MNNSVAMMSFGVTLEMLPFLKPLVFRMQTLSYHLIGPLLLISTKAPSYASLYIFDLKEAFNKRLKRPTYQNVKQYNFKQL